MLPAGGDPRHLTHGNSLEERASQLSDILTRFFPLWLLIGCGTALTYPPTFLWFQKDLITAALALTMLSMGTTLTVEVCCQLRLPFLQGSEP